MSLSENIKNARIKQGLTQEELAEKIGVTRQTIYYYESGERTPKVEHLEKLSKVLKVSMNKLCK